MKHLLRFIFCLFCMLNVHAENCKVLHLSFHQGLIKEFEAVGKELSLDVTSWYIQTLPEYFFDPAVAKGNQLYNIGHDRAQRIWEKHKDFFNQFDVILTSDTAPLSRIFLQNDFKKNLVIWVCNRFDYSDGEKDCEFPDPEYYELMRQAPHKKNVVVIGYTPFETHYAASKGVQLGDLIIKPCFPFIEDRKGTSIPLSVVKSETFSLPPRHNETIFMNLSSKLTKRGIKNYCGNYNGPNDLKDFKGVIHLPYAWSNLALFENLQLGMPYFVPTQGFLKKLMREKNYWFQDSGFLLDQNLFQLTEWYCKEVKDVLIYFDSWEDLVKKIKTTDYAAARARSKAFGAKHKAVMLERWKKVFDGFRKS